MVHCRLLPRCQDIITQPGEMRAGRSSYLKVEGVQVSGILYLTGPGVSVCIRPIIGDLCPQFCHDTSNMWLNTREPPVSAVKVMYAAGVEGGGGIRRRGSQATPGNMLRSPEKKVACQRFATRRRGQCMWTCYQCCCR